MPRLPYRGAPLQGCGRRTPFLRRILLILRGRAYEGSECLRESGNKIRSDNHLKCCLYATNPYGCPSVRAACARVPGSNEPGEAHPSFCLRTNLTLTRKTRAQFVLVQEQDFFGSLFNRALLGGERRAKPIQPISDCGAKPPGAQIRFVS